MTTIRFVLGDHLSQRISSLRDLGRDDVVLMAAVAEETGYVGHHKHLRRERQDRRHGLPLQLFLLAFLLRHEAALGRNPRLVMPYRTLAGWTAERRSAVLEEADRFLASCV